MCGIAGYVGPEPLDRERIDTALELMRHRGPDDRTARTFETSDGRHVALLHGRLTIIDFDERSNQPYRVGGTWLSYNGELYNYVEVRRALEAEGETFATSSDTEVLLRQLVRHGLDGLDACEGMWAFATYDDAAGTVALCRDRFGEKPLYLLRDAGGGLYFGSEVKLLAALAGRPLKPNLEHLRRYLVNGYKALYKGGDTFFESVEELAPGSVLEIGRDGELARRYWDAAPPAERAAMSYDEAVAGTRERLIRSVELRLRADTPLAFCMSGGIDSLSLISIAKRVFGYDVHGFTIVNSDERYEEQDMVDHAVEQLGVRHTAIPVDTDRFLPRLRELVHQHDAPLYTITYYAHWLLMQSIHEHGYRVSVSGTAADELYSGYYDHHLAYLRDVRPDTELFERSVANWREHIAPIVRNPYLQDPFYLVEDPARRDHVYLDAGEFSAMLTRPFTEPFTEADLAGDRLLRNRMLNELFHESVPVILHEDDLNAMSFSIENRSPFLDRALYEWACSVPTRHLVQRGMAKAVLRDAMREIVPDKILDNRRKVGFNAPVLDFLDVDDPAVQAELGADSPVWELVRRDAVHELLTQEWLPNSKSKFLFNFLCVKLFLEEHGT